MSAPSYAILHVHSAYAPKGFYRVAATRRDLSAAQDYATRMVRRGRLVRIVALNVPLGAGSYIARPVADRLTIYPTEAR